jgi:hypothetical protein
MNRLATRLLLVLASGWFVPVSCSTATAVLAQVSAADSERAWTPQQQPLRFRLVARPGEGNAPFRMLTLASLPDFKAKQPQSSFLMEQDSGKIEDQAQHTTVSYRVLARTPAGQEIEVGHEDGDDQSFSRYRATATDIEPISTRQGPVSRGIVMGAMVDGFVLAFLIYVVARILKFVLRRRLTLPASPRP